MGPIAVGTYLGLGGLQYRCQHAHVLQLLLGDIHCVQDGQIEFVSRDTKKSLFI